MYSLRVPSTAETKITHEYYISALLPKNIIQGITDKDQNGLIEGRPIADIIRYLLWMIKLHVKEKKSGLNFVADLEKAFDTLTWQYIYKCLECFNIGNFLISWAAI